MSIWKSLPAASLGLLLLSSVSGSCQTPVEQTPVDSQPVPLPPAPAPATPVVPPTPDSAPATVPTPPPDSPATPVAVPDQASASIANRDAATLHPKLNPTDLEIRSAINEGRNFGKTNKDFIDLIDGYRMGFEFKRGGIIGEERRPVGVAYFLTPSLEAKWRGFLETREFATNDVRDQNFLTVREHVASADRRLTFIVEILPIIPKPKDGDTPPTPTEELNQLTNVRFVLSDDKDNNYDPISDPEAPRIVSRQLFFDAIAGAPDRVFAAQTTSDLPLAPSDNQAGVLVKRRPKYTGPAAFYLVSFNAYSANGNARFNRDSNLVSLRILLPNGPKYAAFQLNRMP